MINVSKLKVLLFFLFISMFCAGFIFAQDPIGGPYTPDENTILLMHFDNEANLLKNVATVAGAVDGVAHGALIALPSGLGLRPETMFDKIFSIAQGDELSKLHGYLE